MDELLHLLTDQGCHPIGYADDILVIVRGMHLDALMGVMQQTLKVVDLCINSLVEQSQAEDGHGQVGKSQRADP